MWPLNLINTRHWIFLCLCVVFLASYTGFISWAKVAQALEQLADQPAVRERFATPIGRGEAIVTSFMFFLLTPLALAAGAGLLAFIGAICAGVLRSLIPVRDLPDWFLLGVSYVVIGIAIFLLRPFWIAPVMEVVGLVAKAILIATQ